MPNGFQITQYDKGGLAYKFDNAKAHADFNRVIQNYRIQRNGTGIFFHSIRDNSVSCYFNTFDNTMLINDPKAYDLANLFGTKRFIVGNARLALEEKQIEKHKIQKFPRDLAFPLEVKEEAALPYRVLSLQEYQQLKNFDIYNELVDFFNQYADFTPQKQQEYLTGALADKYCRFNTPMNKEHQGIRTLNLFMVDGSNRLVGTISALIHVNKAGITDIYLYDEVVKHEPHRKTLLKHLFAAARQGIKANVPSYKGAHAFIRAAADRENCYKELGCSATNTNNYVIHGPRTEYAAALDELIKQYATEKLQHYKQYQNLPGNQQQHHSNWLCKAGLGGAAIAAMGFFAYKAFSLSTSEATPALPNLSL
ncbi:MAG TPA: hypothetical protein VHA13_00840 [Gammaproteobacteria bacterium]|nr:hypothetical protein [Gammaproteobacteria bacterium]